MGFLGIRFERNSRSIGSSFGDIPGRASVRFQQVALTNKLNNCSCKDIKADVDVDVRRR